MDKLRELITKYWLQEWMNSRDNIRILSDYIDSLLDTINIKETDIANKELEIDNMVSQSMSNS